MKSNVNNAFQSYSLLQLKYFESLKSAYHIIYKDVKRKNEIDSYTYSVFEVCDILISEFNRDENDVETFIEAYKTMDRCTYIREFIPEKFNVYNGVKPTAEDIFDAFQTKLLIVEEAGKGHYSPVINVGDTGKYVRDEEFISIATKVYDKFGIFDRSYTRKRITINK